MTEKPMQHWSELCKRRSAIIDLIMDTLTEHNVPAVEGSELLAFLAGMSNGVAGISALDLSEPIARGFEIGAREGWRYE